MKKTIKLLDLDCGHCADKIQNAVKKIDGVTSVSDAERFLRQRTGTKDGGHRIGHIPPASCASDCPVSAITQGREKRDLFLAGRTYPVDS